jgi:hypothetical protein
VEPNFVLMTARQAALEFVDSSVRRPAATPIGWIAGDRANYGKALV